MSNAKTSSNDKDFKSNNTSVIVDDYKIGQYEHVRKVKKINYNLPLYGEYWIKCMDGNAKLFYYNIKTGESAFLHPCIVCHKMSDKYCLNCKSAYCNHHFKKEHKKNAGYHDHVWKDKEPSDPKVVLKDGDVFCIECNYKVATLMCLTCWDGYCSHCFDYTHDMGALLQHKASNYRQVIKGWTRIQNFGREDDYYVNGTTGESTYEKPEELMTEFELELLNTLKEHERTTKENLELIEKLQYDLEKAKYEKIKVLTETSAAIEEAAKNSINLDNSRIKELSKSTTDMITKNSVKFAEYQDKLLSPDDRPRGLNALTKIGDAIKECSGGQYVEDKGGHR